MAVDPSLQLLLELPTSSAASAVFLSPIIQAFVTSGQLHGVVRPDIPQKSAMSAFLSTPGRRPSKFKMQMPFGPWSSASETFPSEALERTIRESRCWQVHTVAAQLRSFEEIRKRLVAAAESLDESGGSLLLVSGGHPLRGVPFVEKFYPADSFDMLSMASKLRQSGDIPHSVQLWAVENPLANTVERVERKILAGAEAVIVQPPLHKDIFEDWWNVAHSRGLMERVRVVVGLPLITSADSLEFWFGLTGTSGKMVESRLAELRRIESKFALHGHSRSAFYRDETIRLINFARALPGVAGLHFMPVTPAGWRQLAALREQNFV